MIVIELERRNKCDAFVATKTPYVFATLQGSTPLRRLLLQREEYFIEWTMCGSKYRTRFESNQGILIIERDGACIARGKPKAWSLWGTMIYDCFVRGGPCFVARARMCNPRVRYQTGGIEVGRAYVRKRFTCVRLEYLLSDEVFLPIALADILYWGDPRRQSTPG